MKRSGWIWFAAWSGPGIVIGFQVSAVGLLVLPLGLLAFLVLWRLTGPGPELLGMLEGVAVACLVVVALNADYWSCPASGEVITRTPNTLTVESCGELNPWPWLIAGLVLALGAPIAYALARSPRPLS